MFTAINISLDFKHLLILQNALENEISYKANICFSNEDKEEIEELKMLLNKLNKQIKDMISNEDVLC